MLHTVVIVDGSPQTSITCAARHILQLQLTLIGGRAHVLPGTAGRNYRNIVRRLDADSIVFVGPPPTASRAVPMISVKVAVFRKQADLVLHDGVERLSSQPRLAATKLLSASLVDGVHHFSLDSARGAVCHQLARDNQGPRADTGNNGNRYPGR
jgi:hypothetical protein